MIGHGTKDKLIKIVIIAFLLILAVIVLYPLFWLLVTSVRNLPDVLSSPMGLPVTIHLKNYVSAWNQSFFGKFYLNTIVIVAFSSLLLQVVAVPAAYSLGVLRFRGSEALLMFFIFGIAVPSQAILIPLFLIVKSLGMINTYQGLVLTYVGMCPFAIFILTGFFRNIPNEIIDAARIDGCSTFGILRYVVFPLGRSAVSAVSIFYFLAVWNDLIFPLILTTDESLYTIQLGIRKFSGKWMIDYPLICAALLMGFIPPLIFYLVFQRAFQKGLTEGALKA